MFLPKITLERRYINLKKVTNFINRLINYLYVLRQETEFLIPAQTGNRTIKLYTSTKRILSVDH